MKIPFPLNNSCAPTLSESVSLMTGKLPSEIITYHGIPVKAKFPIKHQCNSTCFQAIIFSLNESIKSQIYA